MPDAWANVTEMGRQFVVTLGRPSMSKYWFYTLALQRQSGSLVYARSDSGKGPRMPWIVVVTTSAGLEVILFAAGAIQRRLSPP